MAKTGRPEVLDERRQETLCALVKAGVSRRQAAFHVGCNPATVAKRVARDAAFEERLREAEVERKLRALESLGQHSQRSWRAAVWILENTCPEFAKKAKQEQASLEPIVERLLRAVCDVVEDEALLDAIFERVEEEINIYYGGEADADSAMNPPPENVQEPGWKHQPARADADDSHVDDDHAYDDEPPKTVFDVTFGGDDEEDEDQLDDEEYDRVGDGDVADEHVEVRAEQSFVQNKAPSGQDKPPAEPQRAPCAPTAEVQAVMRVAHAHVWPVVNRPIEQPACVPPPQVPSSQPMRIQEIIPAWSAPHGGGNFGQPYGNGNVRSMHLLE